MGRSLPHTARREKCRRVSNALYQPRELCGQGLVLRPWDDGLVREMAAWGAHGFPYHAFDLTYLRDRFRAQLTLRKMQEAGPHLHFVAMEGGRAVARASVNPDDAAGVYLWSVHVPPEFEGNGLCRRMLATIMTWLESEVPGRPFVLTSNSFASHAHRAYAALGFSITETRWHFDVDVARELWKASEEVRQTLTGHTRFVNGRWEVRAHVFSRRPGTPMELLSAPRPVEQHGRDLIGRSGPVRTA